MDVRSQTDPGRRQGHKQNSKLILIKLAHTIIWAFFVGFIVAIPFAALLHRFDWALAMTAAVLVECGVLLANRWRCPLTDLAAPLAEERAENFDIYLPVWLARHNKTIFGALFIAGELVVIACWLR